MTTRKILHYHPPRVKLFGLGFRLGKKKAYTTSVLALQVFGPFLSAGEVLGCCRGLDAHSFDHESTHRLCNDGLNPLGFKGLGFKGLGSKDLGFKGLGFRV